MWPLTSRLRLLHVVLRSTTGKNITQRHVSILRKQSPLHKGTSVSTKVSLRGKVGIRLDQEIFIGHHLHAKERVSSNHFLSSWFPEQNEHSPNDLFLVPPADYRRGNR